MINHILNVSFDRRSTSAAASLLPDDLSLVQRQVSEQSGHLARANHR